MAHERVLAQLRERIRTREYVLTLHAEEEMNADAFSIFDLERAVLTGVILEVQRDRETGERKYRVRGSSRSDRLVEMVVKLGATGTMIIITVYEQ